MEDVVFVSDSGLGGLAVAEFDSVREEKGLGSGVDYVEATVVFEGGTDVEAIVTTESLGLARTGFVVDDNRVSDGAEGSGVEVEGAVIVFPGGYFRVVGGLAKEI